MSSVRTTITTTIPVFNGESFIAQTLESVARQTLRPDRVVVLDNGSTDRTESIVRQFTGINCEFVRNPTNLGLFGNFNRCLGFAAETEFLQILHADDTIEPPFYKVMASLLSSCDGLGLAWCLDERIDEHNRRLSLSGKADGKVEWLSPDNFLKRKAEIGNQAFAATLLKTSYRPVPCRFPTDMPILGDMVYWAQFGARCEKLVHVRLPLARYRWNGANATTSRAPSIDALILDEWKTMQIVEALREHPWGLARAWKLRGLLAVRSGIKAKRYRQRGNAEYSRQIVEAARGITGMPLWLAGQALVELRDLVVYTILRRPKHPGNMFS
jgi:glycosyltransferase involved in cell wall biosynthesis